MTVTTVDAVAPPPISVAVTVHVPGVEGALKNPDLLSIVPHEAAQVTSEVAENCSVPFTTTVGFWGAIVRVEPADPVPDSETVCGLLPAESVSVRTAVLAPATEGLKATLTEQLAAGARLEPQV